MSEVTPASFVFSHQHILTAEQFSKKDLAYISIYAIELQRKYITPSFFSLLNGRILASSFFEASTRTRLSFEAAMNKLGGRVISTVGFQFSFYEQRGESG